MLQSFIIILREGFESFLLVAVILSYLRKSGQRKLVPAVYWAIMLALLLSGGSLLVGAVGRTDLLGSERAVAYAHDMHRSLHGVILAHDDHVIR